jgi:hypothetical protein
MRRSGHLEIEASRIFSLFFTQFLKLSSADRRIALLAGEYPAKIPMVVENTRELAATHQGMIDTEEPPPPTVQALQT